VGRAWCAAVLAAVLVAGCGGDPKPPVACSSGARLVLGALRDAPGAVKVDGTPISTCVKRSLGTGEMQTLGFTYVAAANSLLKRIPHSNDAALQLGFLVGAVRRGANETNGIQLELLRRLEQVAGVDGPPGAAGTAYRRGMAAGEDRG
jgi:hypothetical protein